MPCPHRLWLMPLYSTPQGLSSVSGPLRNFWINLRELVKAESTLWVVICCVVVCPALFLLLGSV
jgi:hypothetical protein